MIRLQFFADISGTRGLITKLLELQKIQKITDMHMRIAVYKFQCYHIFKIFFSCCHFFYLFFIFLYSPQYFSLLLLQTPLILVLLFHHFPLLFPIFLISQPLFFILSFLSFCVLTSNLDIRREKRGHTISFSYLCPQYLAWD